MKGWRKALFAAGIVLVVAGCAAGATLVAPKLFLSNAFQSWGTVKSLRAKITSNSGTIGTQEMTVEFVAPNKFHLLTKDPAGKELELYLIETEFYMKLGNKWTKLAMPVGLDLDWANPQKVAANMGAQSDVRLVGAEMLDGVPTVVYQYMSTYTPTLKYPIRMWIGVLDNLPRKVESEPRPGQKTTAVFYDYDAPITINAPI